MRRAIQLIERTPAVSEYTLAEHRVRRLQRTIGIAPRTLSTDTVELRGAVHSDASRGRGSCAFSLPDSQLRDARAAIRGAAERAAAGTGPSWRLPPPAAPARVELEDSDIGPSRGHSLEAIVDAIHEATRTDGPAHDAAQVPVAVTGTATIEARDVEVRTSTGFRAAYRATALELELVVRANDASHRGVNMRVMRRRIADVDATTAVVDLARRLREGRDASPVAAGTYDLVLGTDALAFSTEGSRFGWFAPLVAQADGAAARSGLTHYLPGQPIFGGAASTGDPISVASDGAVAFGTYSRPFSDEGAATRRFSLVDNGVASELALDNREAALRGAMPNGGVRNIVVDGGTTSSTELRSPARVPVIEIASLAALDIDRRTGDLVASIGGGARVDGGKRRIAGGLIRGNLFAWLARARLSREVADAGWYFGPIAIRIDAVDLL